MKKDTLILVLFFMTPVWLAGQERDFYWLDQVFTTQFRIVDGLAQIIPVEDQSNMDRFLLTDLFQWSGDIVSLDDADLVITYTLKRPPGRLKSYKYLVRTTIQSSSGDLLPIIPEALAGGRNTILSERFGRGKTYADTIRWLNAQEEALEYHQLYKLSVSLELRGDFEVPTSEPRFTFREQSPHYVGLLAGGGLIVLGWLSHEGAENDYGDYEDIWLEGGTKREAEPFINSANNKENSYQTLSYLGMAIIGVDAVWYTARWARNNRKKRLYNLYGKEPMKSVSLQPYYSFSPVWGGSTGMVGATLTLNF